MYVCLSRSAGVCPCMRRSVTLHLVNVLSLLKNRKNGEQGWVCSISCSQGRTLLLVNHRLLRAPVPHSCPHRVPALLYVLFFIHAHSSKKVIIFPLNLNFYPKIRFCQVNPCFQIYGNSSGICERIKHWSITAEIFFVFRAGGVTQVVGHLPRKILCIL
jgi:hypothetical protein